jgi:Domain of unknown function (DUF6647)
MLKAFLCAIALLTLAMARSVNAQEPATSPSIQVPGTECDIVLDGAKFRRPANCSEQALLAAIETWLSVEFDLPIVRAHPRLKLVSPAEIAALRFKGLLSNPGTGIAPNDHGTSSAEGDTAAVYHDATQSIYLPEGWSGSTPAELSVLVHEMVHHFQNVFGLKFECPQEREKLAYIAQDRWLAQFGQSLEGDFHIDAFSLLVKTQCFW